MTTIRLLSTTYIGDILSGIEVPDNFVLDDSEFIETASCISIEKELQIKNFFQQSLVVVFTSMNAVEMLGNIEAASVANWKIYCIGSKTAEFVAEFFPSSTLQGTAHNAKELADLIVEENVSEKIYFFCGNIRRDDLPDTILKSDMELEELVVYNTIKLNTIIDIEYDGILFFSPSAVESFFSVNKISDQVVLFAIGKTTGEALEKCRENKIVISGKTSKLSLINESIAYFKNKKI